MINAKQKGNSMRFGSVCSGIEAASMAWNQLGWEASWLAEIEPFPSAVLKHHYPDTPNYGDMTKLPEMVLNGEIEAPDVLVGGTPCQSFSVAGAREGLSDERGQLTIKYVELANAIDTIRRRDGKDECIIVWENVPGVLSSKDNAFGCFIAALAGGSSEARSPRGGRWSNAGYVLGPQRAVAWRILDAKYFGLAQRRKRVFVVASARDGLCPAEVLFEFGGVRRDTQPSREARQEATGDVGDGIKSAGSHGELIGTLCARDFKGVGNQYVNEGKLVLQGFRKLTFESYTQDETASTMMARDYKSYTDLVASSRRQTPVSGDASGVLDTSKPQAQAVCIGGQHPNAAIGEELAPTLTEAMGAGGGHIPITVNPKQQAMTCEHDLASTLAANDYKEPQAVVIAGTQNDYFRDATENLAPTLRSGNGGGVVNQAITIQGSMIGRKPENGPQGSGYDDTGVCFTQTSADRHAVALPAAVRRLTPVECERLQGFPDNYTQIPWRNKPAEECPDGHRYKALGNSMAVPVMRWIGERISAHLA